MINNKPRKENIVPNILLLLLIEKSNIKSLVDNSQLELNAVYYLSFDDIIPIYQYTVSLVKINLDFRRRLRNDYR